MIASPTACPISTPCATALAVHPAISPATPSPSSSPVSASFPSFPACFLPSFVSFLLSSSSISFLSFSIRSSIAGYFGPCELTCLTKHGQSSTVTDSILVGIVFLWLNTLSNLPFVFFPNSCW